MAVLLDPRQGVTHACSTERAEETSDQHPDRSGDRPERDACDRTDQGPAAGGRGGGAARHARGTRIVSLSAVARALDRGSHDDLHGIMRTQAAFRARPRAFRELFYFARLLAGL